MAILSGQIYPPNSQNPVLQINIPDKAREVVKPENCRLGWGECMGCTVCQYHTEVEVYK